MGDKLVVDKQDSSLVVVDTLVVDRQVDSPLVAEGFLAEPDTTPLVAEDNLDLVVSENNK